jgi:hypothetical protein
VTASFLGALLAGGASFSLADAIVSAHIRALMAPQPTDVASPGHHTVSLGSTASSLSRPLSKISPLRALRSSVPEPSAALVYCHGKHVISLTEMPGTRGLSSSIGHRARL